uniref:Tc1-like transposase DDE domain-containing protein n=1 Tax=Chromera velia CCMP2878 TaxID=1169474 RepID=A0A0G4GV28_9ALVE|eukprot:Cvel_5257.t1-p1 / transcript=Cvel_5257.t1 / gene=Cvel_5257 / organism=Chromera_velia_CCMP2878 / gene_product=hypothetical protein / transcript_product=hypothetical protein / location=Cvel_scaffold242:107851-108849(+) / protein_length=333 / sequence_SO=supercontig / SO=protein_coding / is_pseudo=false
MGKRQAQKEKIEERRAKRVLSWKKFSGGVHYKRVAVDLTVLEKTAHRWRVQYDQGRSSDFAFKGPAKKLKTTDVQHLEQYRKSLKGTTMENFHRGAKLLLGVDFHYRTLCRAFRLAGYVSNKKSANQASEANPRYVRDFASVLNSLKDFGCGTDSFVFVDEAKCLMGDSYRARGWEKKGKTLYIPYSFSKKHVKVNVLAAMAVDGIVGTDVLPDLSVDSVLFEKWLEAFVLSRCGCFPGRRSVLIMDNASFHDAYRLWWLCWSKGVFLLFLPPYCPQFNAVEFLFWLLKARLKRHPFVTMLVGSVSLQRVVSLILEAFPISDCEYCIAKADVY